MSKLVLRLILLLPVLWCTGFAVYVYGTWHLRPYEGDAEGILVLTGGEGRVETGVRLLAENHARRLLISGVHRDVKVAELIGISHQDKNLAGRIDLGFAAQDTLGNADEAASWVEKHHIGSLIVVTAHYHMPRALLHLGSQLPDVALYPYPVRSRLFLSHDWFRNAAALRLVAGDYNKFLATYPQILFLQHF